MKHFPDFSAHSYQIIREIGRNREGGRITWQAVQQTTDHTVILKQFCFAQVGSDWSAFSTHQQELKVLQSLSHSGIPRYIESFETTNGFCLVQEYVDAPSLAKNCTFSPEQIQQIASSVLDILVYLQNQPSMIIHRDIKPENILVDHQLKAYLIDFGFSRIGSGDVSGSSVFKGTPGFIPPEQLWQPTKGTDLYGLGATLLCLLTHTPSTQIHKLTDSNDPYKFKFARALPTLSQDFIYWLHKMVEPNQKERFQNAQTALEALQSLRGLRRLPEVALEPNFKLFVLRSKQHSEKLTATIAVSNPVPETLLEGRWEVAPHPYDPPHRPDAHSWISIHPAKFRRNSVTCEVRVDTSKLVEEKVYERQILLYTNAALKPQLLTLKIHTGSLSHVKPLPYVALILLLLISGGVTWLTLSGLISWLILAEIPVITFLVAATVGFLAIAIGIAFTGVILYGAVYEVVNKLRGDANNPPYYSAHYDNVFITLLWLGGSIAFLVALFIGLDAYSRSMFSTSFYQVLGLIGDLLPLSLMIFSISLVYQNLTGRGFKKRLVYALLIFTVGFGSSIGISLSTGSLSSTLLMALVGTGLPLTLLSFVPVIQQKRLMAKYRKSQELLIKS